MSGKQLIEQPLEQPKSIEIILTVINVHYIAARYFKLLYFIFQEFSLNKRYMLTREIFCL